MTRAKALAAFTLAAILASGSGHAQITDRPSAGAGPTPPAAARQPAFLVPDFVSTVVSGPLALLGGNDRQKARERLFYVVGFSMAADRRCDFLQPRTLRELLREIEPAVGLAYGGTADDATESQVMHLSAGLSDGAAYMSRSGCSSTQGVRIMRSLAALWEAV